MRKLRVSNGVVVFAWVALTVFLTGCPEAQQRGKVPGPKKPATQAGAKADDSKGAAAEAEGTAEAKTPKAEGEAAENGPGEGEAPEPEGLDDNSSTVVEPEPTSEESAPEESAPEADPDNISGLPLLPNPLLEEAIKEAEATKDQIPVVEEPKLPELGEPLVDKRENLQRLQRGKPLWLDQGAGRVVMIGRVCQTETPLEMFACLTDTKEHEAVVAVDVRAYVVHAGLLAAGADTGNTVKWDPKYVPASGSEIDITLHWKDKEGKIQTAKAQDWIRNTKTKKAMTYPFVFAGSGFWEDQQTGKKHYQAEGGDFICVSNFPTAMLDLPIKSSQETGQLMFEAFTEHIPPRGTPVTMVLTVAEKDQPAEKEKAEPEGEESEGAPKPEDQPAEKGETAEKEKAESE